MRKRTYTRLEPANILFAICPVAAIKVYQQTEEWRFSGLAFLCPLVFYLVYLEIRCFLRRKALLESGIDVVDRMSGVEFEELLLTHFKRQGYAGSLTQETGDYGADLILEKAGTRTVVQAKRWRQPVGIEAVQQVIGALRYYQATRGMVVTNSVYTPNAEQLAKVNDIELIDREKLIAMLRMREGKGMVSEIDALRTREPDGADRGSRILPDETCPYCGRILVKRRGKYGAFLGCSGFPACHFTRQG